MINEVTQDIREQVNTKHLSRIEAIKKHLSQSPINILLEDYMYYYLYRYIVEDSNNNVLKQHLNILRHLFTDNTTVKAPTYNYKNYIENNGSTLNIVKLFKDIKDTLLNATSCLSLWLNARYCNHLFKIRGSINKATYYSLKSYINAISSSIKRAYNTLSYIDNERHLTLEDYHIISSSIYDMIMSYIEVHNKCDIYGSNNIDFTNCMEALELIKSRNKNTSDVILQVADDNMLNLERYNNSKAIYEDYVEEDIPEVFKKRRCRCYYMGLDYDEAKRIAMRDNIMFYKCIHCGKYHVTDTYSYECIMGMEYGN